MPESRYFRGIDFANKKANHGECIVRDDGETLTAFFRAYQPVGIQLVRTAVDCAFGTSAGFEAALRGERCSDIGTDGYKTRVTERLLGDRITEFQSNQDWRERDKEGRKLYPRASYFNKGSHIQPSVGLVIVPECLHWLAQEVARNQPSGRCLECIKQARRGEGPVVEAHPRIFLYSAIERVRTATDTTLPLGVLDAAAGYKAKGQSGEASRRTVYRFLEENKQWIGAGESRLLTVEGGEEELIELDHAFDAWLSALTAWQHTRGETLPWDELPGLDRATVDIEGHILILRY